MQSPAIFHQPITVSNACIIFITTPINSSKVWCHMCAVPLTQMNNGDNLNHATSLSSWPKQLPHTCTHACGPKELLRQLSGFGS